MQSEWLFIGLFLVAGMVLPGLALVISWLIAPKKPNVIKQSTYECGVETVGDAWVQFKAEYYVFALAFLIFDVETVFLFPWALSLDKLPLFAVVEGIIFILILLAGLFFIWQKGELEWV